MNVAMRWRLPRRSDTVKPKEASAGNVLYAQGLWVFFVQINRVLAIFKLLKKGLAFYTEMGYNKNTK